MLVIVNLATSIMSDTGTYKELKYLLNEYVCKFP